MDEPYQLRPANRRLLEYWSKSINKGCVPTAGEAVVAVGETRDERNRRDGKAEQTTVEGRLKRRREQEKEVGKKKNNKKKGIPKMQ
ncbi:hypothetical protein RUM43_009353 [Polyplax serrata]|uniref:Uncharacterized protein n=1 Tax=Polyplax serrata TaxID=468196 RepID=A0AAN8NQB8_POLSC